ncbi:MAG: hypothetical protein MK212_02225 [Saprospiraceae bacterium]|nr:hypothetical protein [Saprospiraceae bacterium]
MIQHFIEQISSAPNQYATYQWGKQLSSFNAELLDSYKIAILGYSNQESPYFSKLRTALYSLKANFHKDSVVDLGNIKGGLLGLEECLKILLDRKIIPIVISDSSTNLSSQLKYYKEQTHSIRMSYVDSHLEYHWKHQNEESDTVLNTVLPLYPTCVEQLNCIGYQSYFVDNLVLDQLDQQHIFCERLGSIRSNLSEIEPIIRDSNFLYFNLSAIKSTEAPNTAYTNPNGFLAEEACAIVRYAALGDRLQHICLNNYTEDKEDYLQTARLLAQMIWYIVEGVRNRKYDYPMYPENFTHYTVDSIYTPQALAFVKSIKSDRWWFILPSKNPSSNLADIDHLGVIPCSPKDYQIACEGDLTDRLLKALKKSGYSQ